MFQSVIFVRPTAVYTQGKEPIVQHEFLARPWAKVGADLCDFREHTLLVVCDYYSNFIEVESITKADTSFARSLRHCLPSTVCLIL